MRALSTKRSFCAQCIMPRSFSPTSSISWLFMRWRMALKPGAPSLVFQNPVAREGAVLDVFQNLLHVCLGFGIHDAWAGNVFAVFGRVGDRVVHVGDAAFINQVHDQLGFVQAFEVCHFRRISRFNQRFVTRLDQFDDAAAKHSLFTEQVGLGLFAERSFDHAGAGVADGFRIRQGNVFRGAGCVLMDRNETRQTKAHLVLGAQRVALGPSAQTGKRQRPDADGSGCSER